MELGLSRDLAIQVEEEFVGEGLVERRVARGVDRISAKQECYFRLQPFGFDGLSSLMCYHVFHESCLKEYIKWMQQEDPDDTPARPYTTRYIGSFVADFHRNLMKGGIYIYPANTRNPSGKLRLMYEANPMAFIVEQAGGRAETGHGPILDVEPEALHDRTPVYIGSPAMVEDAMAFLAGERTSDD